MYKRAGGSTHSIGRAFDLRVVAALFILALLATAAACGAEDLRAYQHGIDFVPLPDGKYYLIWSSSGNPPTGPVGRGWPHDIYYSVIDPAAPKIAPKELIANPEAQEPASSAIATDGHIMVTLEDGWNTGNSVAQRYGVYDTKLQAVKPYPQMVFDGAHSGHVAAVGNRFVVFFSNEWVDGGGVDNLGSGDDVLAKVYSSTGELEKSVDVAVGKKTRDWWPVLAGSDTRACLIWQRFVHDETYADLMLSILDPETGKLIKDSVKLDTGIAYYRYSVACAPALGRFLVLGAYAAGGGFGYLLDTDGNVVAKNGILPGIVRESKSIIRKDGDRAIVVQPTVPTGALVLSVTKTEIKLDKTISDSYEWQYGGTDGIFTDAKTVYIVSLSKTGLVEMTFRVSGE
jgi:hypothetical protein